MIRHTLALMPAAAPTAEPFLILIHESPDQIALRADPAAAGQAYRCACAAWGAGAAAAGVIKGGAAMVPVPAATLGDLSPGALVPGGYFQIETATLDDAQAWAAKLPAATTGAVAIRTIVALPGI